MTDLTREQVIDYLKGEYCNLGAILIGCVSGKISEWPAMRPELIKLVSENASLRARLEEVEQERDELSASRFDNLTTVSAWLLESNKISGVPMYATGEFGGWSPDPFKAARFPAQKAAEDFRCGMKLYHPDEKGAWDARAVEHGFISADLQAQLTTAQARVRELEEQVNVVITERERVIAWRRADEEMIKGQSAQLFASEERRIQLEARLEEFRDTSALTARLTQVEADLETQRTATYQAVEREHAAKKNCTRLEEALKDSKVAIDDWLNLYAEEECSPERVYEARKRIDDAGGTLAYIASIQRSNKQALTPAAEKEAG